MNKLNKFDELFEQVKRKVIRVYPSCDAYSYCWCFIADEEHTKKFRRHAHVNCQDYRICLAAAILDLPKRNKLGILWHEWGHILLGEGTEHTEEEVDEAVLREFGIEILYDDNDIQYVRSKK
jgi:hypothetical protein